MVVSDVYLTTKDVARRLQVDEEVVRRWIRDGQILAFTLPGGRQYRIRPEAITEMESRGIGRVVQSRTVAK